jgi:4,5-DOPA dioxygenase extradiol
MKQPTLFVSHGSPMLALTPSPAQAFLKGLAAQLPRPRAVVAVSAHFTTREPAVVSDPHPPMIYDFGGFPMDLYRIVYPAPGDPALAEEVAALVAAAGMPISIVPSRGFDHGTWVPLSLIWPDADIPIVQLAIQPYRDAAHHLALGRAIASLRDNDVLVVGTGAMTHNLRELMTGGMKAVDAPVEEWAQAFTDWIAEKATAGDVDALVDYAAEAPQAARAHPTDDHFLPFFVALGAAGEGAKGERIHASIEHGALSMDAYRFD